MGLRATFGSLAPAVPGELSSGDLTVENAGDQAVDVRLSLTGEAAVWGWITPATMTLGAGEQATARVTLKLPRAPHPPAGPLDITVSATGGDGAAEARGTLEVAAFADVFATLEPRDGKRGRYLLKVSNRGNVAVPLTIEGDDASVTAHPARVAPAPGATATARVTVRRRTGAAAGTFGVLVRPDGGGRPVRAEGAIEPGPGKWVNELAPALLVLAVAAAGFVVLRNAGSSDQPAPGEASTFDPACPARDHLSPDANGIVREGVRPAFDYTFLFVKEGGCQPVRFNPCQPVRYALNRGLATDAHVAEVIVTGNLVLNLDAVTDTDTRAPVPHGFGTGVNWGRIILHELAHVIGLGHVESRTSIMNEALTQQTLSSSEWGVGDLIGLRQLGREGGCVTVPPVPLQGAPR